MATLRDVAKEAGLTPSTVSRILNNRGYISDNARERVNDAMKKLNYQPNEVARSLHKKNTNTIGVIVPHIRHPYFAEMISHLEEQAYKKGYKILLFNSQNIQERQQEYINICAGNKVAGIILCSGALTSELFGRMDIPVITMECYLEKGTASVECDNRQGGALAAEKLISCGCRHLLHVGNINTMTMPADQRTEGFREVCEREGVPFTEVFTEELEYYNLHYTAMIEKALKDYPETDGIFANSDVIAAQTLQVCRKLHISVPKQLKLVGFDDVDLATLTVPQLTTIRQPVKEMAETAVNLLCDIVSGKHVAKQIIFPVQLIERGTTEMEC